jgi:hypothetical protein
MAIGPKQSAILVPKLRLTTPIREASLLVGKGIKLGILRPRGAAKRSFVERRSQAELGTDVMGSLGPMSSDQLAGSPNLPFADRDVFVAA